MTLLLKKMEFGIGSKKKINSLIIPAFLNKVQSNNFVNEQFPPQVLEELPNVVSKTSFAYCTRASRMKMLKDYELANPYGVEDVVQYLIVVL